MARDTTGTQLRKLLADAELVTLMDLARRWDVSRTRIHQIAAREDFPEPVAEVSDGTTRPVRLYLLAEAQAWRDTPRRPGRPRNPHPKVEG